MLKFKLFVTSVYAKFTVSVTICIHLGMCKVLKNFHRKWLPIFGCRYALEIIWKFRLYDYELKRPPKKRIIWASSHLSAYFWQPITIVLKKLLFLYLPTIDELKKNITLDVSLMDKLIITYHFALDKYSVYQLVRSVSIKQTL